MINYIFRYYDRLIDENGPLNCNELKLHINADNFHPDIQEYILEFDDIVACLVKTGDFQVRENVLYRQNDSHHACRDMNFGNVADERCFRGKEKNIEDSNIDNEDEEYDDNNLGSYIFFSRKYTKLS